MNGHSENIEFTGKFKAGTKEREMSVITDNFGELYIAIERRLDKPSICAAMLQCLTSVEVNRYYNESILVAIFFFCRFLVLQSVSMLGHSIVGWLLVFSGLLGM